MDIKRVFIIVLDSVGIGAAPDAADFGDAGANTMFRIFDSEKFNIPNLIDLGLGSIEGIDYLPSSWSHKAAVCRLQEKSRGKDTTTGHWEMMGIVSEKPMPTLEINVIGKTVLDAIPDVEAFIDSAVLANLEEVRIVHGMGTGKLRAGIHEYLRKCSNVAEFRLGRYGEGETGVTIVKIK